MSSRAIHFFIKLCVGIAAATAGYFVSLSVPGDTDIAELESQRAIAARLVERALDEAKPTPDERDLKALLLTTLDFADYIERIQSSATEAGIVGLRVDSAKLMEGRASEHLRNYGGRLGFDASWSQVVHFLSAIERGSPAMRVRRFRAEPSEDKIRVECVVDAWALATPAEPKR